MRLSVLFAALFAAACFAQTTPSPAAPQSPTAPQNPPSAAPAPAATPPGDAPSETLTGPLRAEVIGIIETRRSLPNAAARAGGESELIVQMRLCGEHLPEIARAARPYFTEAVDETGRSLLPESGYTEQDRTETFRIRASIESLRERGLTMGPKLQAAARAASKFSLKGKMRLIRAGGPTEDIVISSPAELRGQTLDHPRLRELGIQIALVAPGRLPSTPGGQTAIAVEQIGKVEQVKSIEFYDAWLQRIRVNPRNAKTTDDKQVSMWVFPDTAASENLQMVVEVWPQVEDFELPIEIKDISLP